MTTTDPVLQGLIGLWLVSVVANLLYYWGVVCVTLYRNGATFPTGLVPWRYFHNLHHYRAVLVASAQSANRYYVILFLTWFNILLAAAIAGYVLVQSSNEPVVPRHG